jgi:hypothetical protein
LHVLVLSRMLPPLETPTGCHVDAVKLKLSSLRDRPQMPHVDVVKSYSFFHSRRYRKSGIPALGPGACLLAIFLFSTPGCLPILTLFLSNSKTRDNSGDCHSVCDVFFSLGLLFADRKTCLRLTPAKALQDATGKSMSPAAFMLLQAASFAAGVATPSMQST